MDRNRLVLDNLDLPKRLYFSKFRIQMCGIILGREDCLSAGNFALVMSSRSWPESGSFRPYAAKAIIHRVHLEAFRKNRKIHREVGIVEEVVESREDRFGWEEYGEVMRVIDRLPERMKSVLLDRFLGEMTTREIKQKQGIGGSTLQKEIENALSLVKYWVEGCS